MVVGLDFLLENVGKIILRRPCIQALLCCRPIRKRKRLRGLPHYKNSHIPSDNFSFLLRIGCPQARAVQAADEGEHNSAGCSNF
jgi:hypothetical protein